ncbi:MAG: periplasmic heavy metal sensor [Ignavibacteria bacterium]
MKRYIPGIIVLLFLGVLPFNNIKAQDYRDKMWGKGLIKQLNLTQEQKDQIQKFRIENQKKLIDMKAEAAKIHLQMKESMTAKNLDENTILDLSKKVSGIQADIKTSMLAAWFKAYKILDDKQKETFIKFAPMLKEKAGKMCEKFEKRGDMKQDK